MRSFKNNLLRKKPLCLAISGLLFFAPLSLAQGPAPEEIQTVLPPALAEQLRQEELQRQQQPLEPHQMWSVRVSYESRDDIQRLSLLIDHMQIDEAKKTIRIEIGTESVAQLRTMGFKVEVDFKESKSIQNFQNQRREFLDQQKAGGQQTQGGDAAVISTRTLSPLFGGPAACYRTVEKTNLDIDALATRYPNLIRVVPVGQTWMQTQLLPFRDLLLKYLPKSVTNLLDLTLLPKAAGNPLRAVVIGNQAINKDKKVPRMVTTSSIHAREYTPAEISTRFTEWLVKNYGTDPTATWLLDNNEFHFILHANPDGRKMAEQTMPQSGGAGWRKNVNLVDGYCARHPVESGVDLNRNFPFGWNSTGGKGSSGVKCEATFRGDSAASEPETAAIVKYVAGTRQPNGNFAGGVLQDRRTAATGDFTTGASIDYEGLYFDIHSFSNLVLWPWGIRRSALGGNSQTANDDGMSALGQRLAWYNGYRATQMINYDTDGTTTDTFYGELGAPSFTIELGTSFYEPCDNFEKDTFPKNIASLRYAARTLKAPYRLPLGPDAADLKVSATTVRQGESVTLTATIDDDRYLYDAGYKENQAVTKHDPQPIKAANAYINVLPWQAGAKAIPLKATAGSTFGAKPKVTVSGVIDTSAFAPGRHLIYVQGTNQQDKAGPPDAVFLEVLAKDAPAPCPPKNQVS